MSEKIIQKIDLEIKDIESKLDEINKEYKVKIKPLKEKLSYLKNRNNLYKWRLKKNVEKNNNLNKALLEMNIPKADLEKISKLDRDNLKCGNCGNLGLIECFFISVTVKRTESIYICPKCWKGIKYIKNSLLTDSTIPILKDIKEE